MSALWAYTARSVARILTSRSSMKPTWPLLRIVFMLTPMTCCSAGDTLFTIQRSRKVVLEPERCTTPSMKGKAVRVRPLGVR